VLTFNIAVAAEPRAERILRWLRGRGDELIILSETSSGAGTKLIRGGLEADGYATFGTDAAGERGVLLASRLPVRGVYEAFSASVPCRAQAVIIDTQPELLLVGVYVPSRDRTPAKVARKREFIVSLIESIEALPPQRRRNLVMLGDYNAITRDHEPALGGFFPYEYEFHEELARLELGAAHELKPYGRQQPHSWIGRTGNGYLYDYAHLGAALHSRLTSCRYLHGARRQRLSDHAALAIRLRLGT
jgi:exodeoxyribonuclease-3